MRNSLDICRIQRRIEGTFGVTLLQDDDYTFKYPMKDAKLYFDRLVPTANEREPWDVTVGEIHAGLWRELTRRGPAKLMHSRKLLFRQLDERHVRRVEIHLYSEEMASPGSEKSAIFDDGSKRILEAQAYSHTITDLERRPFGRFLSWKFGNHVFGLLTMGKLVSLLSGVPASRGSKDSASRSQVLRHLFTRSRRRTVVPPKTSGSKSW